MADPLRRRDVNRMHPPEHMIRTAINAVEALPADPRLTAAVVLLSEAQEKVADYIDGTLGPEA